MMHIIIKYLIFGKSSVRSIYMKWGEMTRCETTHLGRIEGGGEPTAPSSDVSLHDLFASVIVLLWCSDSSRLFFELSFLVQ